MEAETNTGPEWVTDGDGFARVNAPGVSEDKPPLPVGLLDFAKQQRQKDPARLQTAWKGLYGSADVAVYETPQVPREVPEAMREQTAASMVSFTDERAQAARDAGIPKNVVNQAKHANMDPRVYFEEKVRPQFETSTDYSTPAETARAAVVASWSPVRAKLAFKAGVPMAVIHKAEELGKDPFKVYAERLDVGHSERGSAPWRPSAATLLEKAGLPASALDPHHTRAPASADTRAEVGRLAGEVQRLERSISEDRAAAKAHPGAAGFYGAEVTKSTAELAKLKAKLARLTG